MEVEMIMNRTYQNLCLLVRDLKMTVENFQKYRKGLIVTEPSFIESTCKLGGMVDTCNTRFCILTNQANDMMELEKENQVDFGLYVIGTHAYLLVLDTFQIEKKQLIVLLQIQKQDIPFFQENEVSIHASLVKQVKKQMIQALSEKPIAGIDTDLWLKHTNFPIGMKDDGSFYKEKEEI